MLYVTALQASLRQFAADRDWQAFHTPKNLAMALMVEAAELAEIFQWLTPEQSQLAHQDAALQPRIADELADVLLYLLQLADHTGCDLQRAVSDKLVKNARKHPPLRGRTLPQTLAAPVTGAAAAGQGVATALPSVHVLLDFENVQPDEAELRTLVPGLTHLWLFHGPHQKDLAQRFAGFGPDLSLVPISKSGKNALDFHLSFYAGYIVSRYPQAAIVVVANDKGYAPMLMHAETLGFDVRQVGHARVAAAKRASARRKAAAAAQAKATPAAAAPRKPALRTAAVKRPAPVVAPVSAAVVPAPSPAPTGVTRKGGRKPAATVAAKPAAKPAATVAAKPAAKPAATVAAKGAAKVAAAAPVAPAAAPKPPMPQHAPPALKMVQILARRAGAGPAPVVAEVDTPAPAAAAPAPAKAAVRTRSGQSSAAAATLAEVAPRKLLASLRKMGDSLPAKQGRLLRILKSLLGPDAGAADALAALARLVTAGQVVVAPGGAVSYRL